MSTLLIYAVSLFIGLLIFAIVALAAFIVSDGDDKPRNHDRNEPRRQ
jgi:hypothetical protein